MDQKMLHDFLLGDFLFICLFFFLILPDFLLCPLPLPEFSRIPSLVFSTFPSEKMLSPTSFPLCRNMVLKVEPAPEPPGVMVKTAC